MSSNTLRNALIERKLHGENYIDWLRNLKIVLMSEKILYAIQKPFPDPLAGNATDAQKLAHEKLVEGYDQAKCVRLSSMDDDLQKQCENLDSFTMNEHLAQLFAEKSRNERFNVSRELFGLRMTESTPVHTHGVKVIGLLKRLEDLKAPLPEELAVDLLLQSLSSRFSQFVMNFNMHKMKMSVKDLVGSLKTAEYDMRKSGTLCLVTPISYQSSKSKKRKTKPSTKPKKKGFKKKVNKEKKKGQGKAPTKEKGECFHCGVVGHWKRNCHKYLAELKEKKGKQIVATTSKGI